MADFFQSIGKILRNEGGWVNHASDPGGATNRGITLNTFQKYAQERLGIEPTMDNLKNLSREQASTIYQHEYWNAINGDAINDQDVAGFVFDFHVQSGGAVRQIQKSLQDLGHNIKDDGRMGPDTIKAINATDKNMLLDKMINQRKNYYQKLIQKNPKLKKYEKGFMNRIDGFKKTEPKAQDYFEKIKSLRIS